MSELSTRDAARDGANARDAVRDGTRDSALSVAANWRPLPGLFWPPHRLVVVLDASYSVLSHPAG